ncbi:hypothetical protein [Salinilacihabitans rarus]|uniref:hypothetical protein n=1 Tax=Salinilacihabitans rarus TaxID=2961596 RepID=UPI0020C91E35|nr:hypothetical protein [Salinilacihabitans rarus]
MSDAGPERRAAPDGDERAEEEEAERDDDHLDDVAVGAGCTEIWEHLAERRDE